MRARFITLEGVDGAGKSTHLSFIQDTLAQLGVDAVFTREPGGTALGERLRELLLAVDTRVSLETETLLMFAAREEHLAQVIRPALEAGRWVVSDRFTDATFAYQGGGRGLAFDRIEVLEAWVQRGLQPDLTLLFDVPTEVAAARMAASRSLDRFEREAADFHRRVRDAYLARAKDDPRFVVIDSTQPIAEIQQTLAQLLARFAEQA